MKIKYVEITDPGAKLASIGSGQQGYSSTDYDLRTSDRGVLVVPRGWAPRGKQEAILYPWSAVVVVPDDAWVAERLNGAAGRASAMPSNRQEKRR